MSPLNSDFEFWVVGVTMSLIAVLGLVGNIISMLMFKYKRFGVKNTFTSLLTWLTLVDSIFLVSIFLRDSQNNLS